LAAKVKAVAVAAAVSASMALQVPLLLQVHVQVQVQVLLLAHWQVVPVAITAVDVAGEVVANVGVAAPIRAFR
jgi:hypothetical protein